MNSNSLKLISYLIAVWSVLMASADYVTVTVTKTRLYRIRQLTVSPTITIYKTIIPTNVQSSAITVTVYPSNPTVTVPNPALISTTTSVTTVTVNQAGSTIDLAAKTTVTETVISSATGTATLELTESYTRTVISTALSVTTVSTSAANSAAGRFAINGFKGIFTALALSLAFLLTMA